MDIGPVVMAVVVAALWWGFAQQGGVGRWLRRNWSRVRPYVTSYVRSSPATFVYAGVLMVTTWVVAGANDQLAEALLREQSTNLSNLRHHAVDVMVRSAFWSGTSYALPTIALLAVVLAPAESWLGTRRAIAVFAIGHVGATLLTAAGIALALHFGAAPHGIERTIDVGISYGTFCIAGVLTYRLPRPWRYAWAAGLLAIFATRAGVTGEVSDYGHLVSVALGLACYPLTWGQAVRERALAPLYRPWLVPVTVADAPTGEPAAPELTASRRSRHRGRRRRSASRAVAP
ncbi:MAG: hypothetical protein EPO22_03340 [Dehalococcoidia bacterium]|nr:MAG: hypothetical protein EPO22_03340 [Dehalococcoidia bacterium]